MAGNNGVSPMRQLSRHCPRIPPNAVDHGDKAVGALGGEVFAEPQFVEDGDGVSGGDFGGGAVGVEGDEDGDEVFEDHRVRIAAVGEAGVYSGVAELHQPDLR